MRHNKTAAHDGVALLIVLAFLVLISAIIVAFFSSVTNELAVSKATSDSATTRQLAESAVNVVMAQIVDSTKGQQSKSAVAWASQPGMIRTFDISGTPGDFYKLYSSDKMIVTGNGFDAATDVPPKDWNSTANNELFTDINAPVTNAQGESIYPVVDPAADGSTAAGQTNDLKVDGFSIIAPPGYDSSKPQSAQNNRAPMPVRWLYVLKDGALASASLRDADSVTVRDATTINPIVGRMAFWADDETAKVNINTASEGTYWDVPRVYSKQDFGEYASNTHGMSMCQPVQHEYQRYPGHPATTCLSPIFGKLLPVSSPYPANPQAADSTKLDPYYNIAPRIGLPGPNGGGGGSQGGSLQVTANTTVLNSDTDRLYASVDELMFTPNLKGTSRIPNTSTDAKVKIITKGVLEKAKFFVTANSSAPETTLNNTPRVAVWPIASSSNDRTSYDSLLAFCSTIGGKGYYFTRTPTTGARNGTSDYTPQNARLYQYLQALTKTAVPGFGGKFSDKYKADSDQILTYIYDYIRSTNLQDQSTGAKPYTPLFANGQPPGAGEVVPIRIGQTQGFGRFYSITSANLLFYGTHKGANGKVDKMRAVFFLGFTTPMQGLACMRCNMKYTVTQGLDSFQVQGKPLSFKAGGTNYMDVSDLSLYHGRSVGGTESPWQAIRSKPFNDADAGGDAHGKYPFFSNQDADVSGLTDFAFTAGKEVIVEVRTADSGSDQLVQTFHFKFPPGQFAVPTNVAGTGFGSRTGGNYDRLVDPSDTVVALQVGGGDLNANINSPDSAVDLTAGDIRMTASLQDVPANRFRADMNYKVSKVQMAHCLVQSVGEPFNGAKYGKLANVPDANGQPAYRQTGSIARQPDVPSRVTTGVSRSADSGGGSGDWDTGFGDQKDGAYINKPDEGDTALTDITNGRTRLPYMLGFGAGYSSATNTYFSPNRQIPSPLMFGSIPTGVQRMQPWQTLLFHPRPEDPSHPGKTSPKDHLIADLFWMPVVEPYAISQPFATAGKINLNYQIVPFTYINRSTGVHAVMKSTRFAALTLEDSRVYKPLDATGTGIPPTASDRRQPIDMAATLKAFDARFQNNEIFRSASQICEMNLVPTGETDASMAAFWKNKFAFTGDNLREKPYADLYSRLTTKSNTYTVHVRVQALRKTQGTPANQWVSGKDKIAGEYRGATILERYIDLNDPSLPDFATLYVSNPQDKALNIDRYYKMRIISSKRFSP